LVEAGDLDQAAQQFEKGGFYTESILNFKSARKFQDVKRLLRDHEKDISLEVRKKCLQATRLHFIHHREFKTAESLFEKKESLLDFMSDQGFDDEKKDILCEMKEFELAGKIAETQGDYLEAARLFSKIRSPESLKKASDLLARVLWSKLPFGSDDEVISNTKALLEDVENILNMKELPMEIQLFKFVVTDDLGELVNNVIQGNFDVAGKLLALDRATRDFQVLRDRFDLEKALKTQEVYFRSMIDLASKLNVFDFKTQRFFGYSNLFSQDSQVATSSTKFQIGDPSVLLGMISNLDPSFSHPFSEKHRERTIVHSAELSKMIKSFLSHRIYDRLLRHSDLTYNLAELLPPCHYFTLTDSCGRSPCNRLHPNQISPQSLLVSRVKYLVPQFNIVRQFDWLASSSIQSNEIDNCQKKLRQVVTH
jgi:hypothetical protein